MVDLPVDLSEASEIDDEVVEFTQKGGWPKLSKLREIRCGVYDGNDIGWFTTWLGDFEVSELYLLLSSQQLTLSFRCSNLRQLRLYVHSSKSSSVWARRNMGATGDSDASNNEISLMFR